MSKKRLIHFITFGSASVLTLTFSIVFFASLNKTIDEYYSTQKESSVISTECTGLRREIFDLNDTLNKIDGNIYKWYCTNPSIYCDVYLEDSQIDLENHTCLECGCEVIEINETHKSSIQDQINEKQALLNEKQALESEYATDLAALHEKSEKLQGLAIVFAPISVVSILLTALSSKE